jgi:hypothetical protein
MDIRFPASEPKADIAEGPHVTIRRLSGQLPGDALQAIAAHDRRTGIRSDTLIADILNLADALTVIDQRFGRGRTQP